MQPNPPITPNSPFGADPTIGAAWQRQTDLQHLKLLSIFYYIFGGLQAFGGCMSVIYIVMGVAFTAGGSAADPSRSQQDAQAMQAAGGFMIVFGGCLGILAFTLAGLMVFAGLNLNKQRRRTFCMVAAGIACLAVPLGTILGIFTFLVLNRPSVRMLFEERLALGMSGEIR